MTPEKVDVLIRQVAAIDERLEELRIRREQCIDQLRAAGPGKHLGLSGRTVSVTAPNRSFSVEKAAALIPEAVRATCLTWSYDAKMIKGLLTAEQADACYEPGSGSDRVKINYG